jgi:hypothetical protein
MTLVTSWEVLAVAQVVVAVLAMFGFAQQAELLLLEVLNCGESSHRLPFFVPEFIHE